ncbi:hypothetical protein BX616_011024, partial [Lobosporangium transversale]
MSRSRSSELPINFRSLFQANAHNTRSLIFDGGPLTQYDISVSIYCTRLEYLSLPGTESHRTIHENQPINWDLLPSEGDASDEDSVQSDSGSNNIQLEDSYHRNNDDEDDVKAEREYADDDSLDAWSRLALFVRRNRHTLRALDVNLGFSKPANIPSRAFWEAVVDCFPPQSHLFGPSSARLTSLSIVGREIGLANLMLLWRSAGPHLKRVRLSDLLIDHPFLSSMKTQTEVERRIGGIVDQGSFEPSLRLEDLVLENIRGMTPMTQFKVFIAQSFGLLSLQWNIHQSYRNTRVEDAITEYIGLQGHRCHCQKQGGGRNGHDHDQNQRHWPGLESISITCNRGKGRVIPEEFLTELLKRAGTKLKLVRLRSLSLQEQSVSALG